MSIRHREAAFQSFTKPETFIYMTEDMSHKCRHINLTFFVSNCDIHRTLGKI